MGVIDLLIDIAEDQNHLEKYFDKGLSELMSQCQPKWQNEVEQEGWPDMVLITLILNPHKIRWRPLDRT